MIKTFLNRKLNIPEYIFQLIKIFWVIPLNGAIYLYLPVIFPSINYSKLGLNIALILTGSVILLFSMRIHGRKTKVIDESLVVDNELITIYNSLTRLKISIKEIQDLKIFYRGYNGYRVGRYVSYGDYNRISFKYDNNDYEYQFDLESEEMMLNLASILSYWYEAGYKFKEYNNGQRSFLLNNELNYQEIQELKRKFNFEW
jgi:hypothetical protein